MPFRRRVSRRRRFRRSGRGRIYKAAAGQLWRDVKWLKSVVNVEYKYSDVNSSGSISTTPTLSLLNGLSQGTTGITRTGQSVKVVGHLFRFTCTINASATTTFFRVILVRDSQPNGAAYTAGNLVQTSSDVNSPLVIGFGKRFHVVRDKTYSLALNGRESINGKFFIRSGFHTTYNTSSAGTVGDINTNSYYLHVWSNEATNTPVFAYWSRIRFVDN